MKLRRLKDVPKFYCWKGPSDGQDTALSEVKTRLPELVSGIAEREEEIVVTRNGKPAVVLINYDEYERLKDGLEVLSDPNLMKQIRRSKSFYAKGH